MQWKKKEKDSTKYIWEKRTIKKFCWLPTWTGNEWVWLERVRYYEINIGNPWWYKMGIIPDGEPDKFSRTDLSLPINEW